MRVRGYAQGMPCWAELVTSDPSAVAEFYRDLLGWRYDPADQVFRLRGAAVAGLVPSRGQPAGWVTYIACDDLAELTGLVALPSLVEAGAGRGHGTRSGRWGDGGDRWQPG